MTATIGSNPDISSEMKEHKVPHALSKLVVQPYHLLNPGVVLAYGVLISFRIDLCV